MRILVFQHVASEHPGSFRDVMRAGGHTMHAVELDEGEAIPGPDGFDALLVMGGPMDVWETDKHPWLAEEMKMIRAWVEAGKPYFGVCLGHQLLAQACGGHVGLMDKPEVGMRNVTVTADPLFAGLPQDWPCLEWHGAEVKRLPEDAAVLATSASCPVEAMRLGSAAYGLQFHMELTATTTADWAGLPEYRKALEKVRGQDGLAALQAEVDAQFLPLQDAAHRIFGNFLAIAADSLASV